MKAKKKSSRNLIPQLILNELKRQRVTQGDIKHDMTHTPKEWAHIMAGSWNKQRNRRIDELFDAARDEFDMRDSAAYDAEFDHIMAEFGAIAVAFFRAKEARIKKGLGPFKLPLEEEIETETNLVGDKETCHA